MIVKFVILVTAFGLSYTNPIEAEFDWRTKDAVLPVFNQGQCGTSTIMNALDALSSYTKIKGGNLIRLSQQQVYDCSGNLCPCAGSTVNASQVYDLISSENVGFDVDSEASYPYTGQCTHKCQFTKDGVAAHLDGYEYNSGVNSEPQYKQLLMDSPLVVEVQADTDAFEFYSGGILDDPQCDGRQIDHTLLLVGYGTDNGKDYWIARNSWGTTWGEDGYIRIVRDKNMCGIGYSLAKPAF